jgi:hypothetical protein
MARGAAPIKRTEFKKRASRRVPACRTFEYVRSRALLDLFKALPCQVTGIAGHTDPAHSNWSCHGKGGRIKASDIYVAAIARDIHRELDQGSRWSREERQRIWWDAHVKSVRALLALGLWPAAIPIPNIVTYPF